jgi:hypothetical protein
MIGSRAGRSLLLVAAATMAGIAVSGPAAAGATQIGSSPCPACGHNLIANPGAEKGKGANSDTKVKVPGWHQKGSFTAVLYTWSAGDLTPTSPGPKDRGKNYFYGGPDAAKSTGTQTVKVAAAGIKSGKARYTLSGWLGGYDSQGDYAVLTVTFENAGGKALGTAKIGPVTEAQRKGVSELLSRTRSGAVPAGTRLVQVKLVMIREDGSDNDGLADDLSLKFKLS